MTRTSLLKKVRNESAFCTIRRKAETNEWVVNFRREFGGCESTAYYTEDFRDALDTMDRMNAAMLDRPANAAAEEMAAREEDRSKQ